MRMTRSNQLVLPSESCLDRPTITPVCNQSNWERAFQYINRRLVPGDQWARALDLWRDYLAYSTEYIGEPVGRKWFYQLLATRYTSVRANDGLRITQIGFDRVTTLGLYHNV